MVTTLYLIRHAEAVGNVEEFFQGTIDTDISSKGKLQLKLLKERFKDIDYDVIYSSNLKRARLTAESINEYHSPLEISYDNNLREIYGGDFEGKPWTELPKLYPEQYKIWKTRLYDFEAPNGEKVSEVYDRIVKAINEIVKNNAGKKIVVVSHGCALRNYLCYANSQPHSYIMELGWSDNTAVSKITFDDEFKPTVIFQNNSEHLDEKTSTLASSNWCKK